MALTLSGSPASISPLSATGTLGAVAHGSTEVETSLTANTAFQAINATITPLKASSTFLVMVTISPSLGRVQADTDFGYAVGYRVGGFSSNLNTYTQFGGKTNEGSRERPNGWYPWWSTDTHPNYWNSTYNNAYSVLSLSQARTTGVSYTLGQSIDFCVAVQTDVAAGVIMNGHVAGGTNGGGLSTITVFEIYA